MPHLGSVIMFVGVNYDLWIPFQGCLWYITGSTKSTVIIATIGGFACLLEFATSVIMHMQLVCSYGECIPQQISYTTSFKLIIVKV